MYTALLHIVLTYLHCTSCIACTPFHNILLVHCALLYTIIFNCALLFEYPSSLFL